MRRLHLWIGIGGVIIFLGTGQYMSHVVGPLHDLDSTTRLLYRSAHIYLLLASLVNVALGCYLQPRPSRWRRWLQQTGSFLVLVVPFLLLAAFFVEPTLTDLQRPFARPAIIGLFVGMLTHLLSGAGMRPIPKEIERLE
jgi:hypothetical protein